jgi:hypothetical protein
MERPKMDDPSLTPIVSEAEQILAESNRPKTSLIDQIGHFSSAENSEDYLFDPSQIKITPTQRSLVALMVRGFSLAAASRKLHVNYGAAFRWKGQPWWEPICEEERIKWLQQEGIDTKQEAFAPLVGTALEAVKEALSSEDDKIRMAAVQMVFDNFFDQKRPVGRPKKHNDNGDEESLSFADIQKLAFDRVANMHSNIRDTNGQVNIVANG